MFRHCPARAFQINIPADICLSRAMRPSFTLRITAPPSAESTVTLCPTASPRFSRCLFTFSSAGAVYGKDFPAFPDAEFR